MYINKVFLFGNLTRDPEVRALPSGGQVASFSIATNRVWKDKDGAKQESVDYHNAVCFGKQADTIAQYLRKGSSVFVEGRLTTRSWEGQDGKKNYRTEVIIDRFQFGPKTSAGGAPAASAGKEPQDSAPQEIDYPEEASINTDDIPF